MTPLLKFVGRQTGIVMRQTGIMVRQTGIVGRQTGIVMRQTGIVGRQAGIVGRQAGIAMRQLGIIGGCSLQRRDRAAMSSSHRLLAILLKQKVVCLPVLRPP
jgi:hypothetical protein